MPPLHSGRTAGGSLTLATCFQLTPFHGSITLSWILLEIIQLILKLVGKERKGNKQVCTQGLYIGVFSL